MSYLLWPCTFLWLLGPLKTEVEHFYGLLKLWIIEVLSIHIQISLMWLLRMIFINNFTNWACNRRSRASQTNRFQNGCFHMYGYNCFSSESCLFRNSNIILATSLTTVSEDQYRTPNEETLGKWGHFDRAKPTFKMLTASWAFDAVLKMFRSFDAKNFGSTGERAAKLQAI